MHLLLFIITTQNGCIDIADPNSVKGIELNPKWLLF